MLRSSRRCFSAVSILFSLALAFVLFSLTTAAQTNLQSTPPTHKGPPPPPAPPPAVDQEQFISYWTTETGWQTQLELRNNQVKYTLSVTPVLRATDGSETALSPVTIQPQEVKTLDVA